MRPRFSKTIIAILVLLVFSYLVPHGLSDSYSYSYELLNKPDGSTHYRLNVAVSQSLLDYYREKSHTLNSYADFAKFVTPYALKLIADRLAEIYPDDEDFANGALMIVHQIPYEVTVPSKYPVETIVENKGDCDLLTYVAASIMKAGGLNVVLLYYEKEAHMNLGVSLSHAPVYARDSAFYVTYNDARYYVAESTGGDWQTGWRVGEQPDELKQAYAQAVTLENSEQVAAGQVSASYKTLVSSTLFLSISSTYLIQGSLATLSGQLSPSLQAETITIYMKGSSTPWTVLGTTTTNADGRFTYAWNGETAGISYIRASWSGNDDYAGADSPIQAVTVMSTFFVFLMGTIVALAIIGSAVFFFSRHARQEIPEPQPPEVPS